MSTSEGARRGGRDDPSGGPGGGAANGAFEDDAFDLADADEGEVVYEWVADDDADLAAHHAATPRAGLRETLLRLRADWRGIRRRAAVALAAAALTGAAAAGATAWFDTVARGADDAEVTDIGLDAVVDGDPALAKFDAETARGSAQYLLEIANNGPAAVTLTGLSIDAGTLMTTTGWQPVGSPRIAPGATGQAAITVNLDCGLMVLGRAMTSGAPGPGSFTFPDVLVSVRTGDGETRQVTLSSRRRTGVDAAADTAGDIAGTEVPQITMTDVGQCFDVVEQRDRARGTDQILPTPVSGPPLRRSPDQLTVAYTGVKKAATRSAPEYTLGFRAHNPAAVTMLSLSDPGMTGLGAGDLVKMTPSRSTIPPGGDTDFTLTVKVASCHDGLDADGTSQYFVATTPQPDDFSTGFGAQFGPLGHFLAGSGVQLALDELAQRKAACT